MADYTNQAVRILLVSALESSRDEVSAALADWPGDHQLFWVSQPKLAPRRAREVVPHAILVDDVLGATSVAPLIHELVACAPTASLLVLVEADAMLPARQAILAGARAFVTKPLRGADLVATLQQTLASRRAPSFEAEGDEATRGRIVVFCAPKGGTGRTTTAVNSAISLRLQTKQPVALLDADYSSPALDVALNLVAERDVTDLLPRLTQLDEDLISRVLTPHASGIQALLAPPPEDLSKPISLPQVQEILVYLKRMFAWVLVDLGLPLDETAFAFLDSADRIVMTVLPDMVGLRNTRLMLNQLYARGYPEGKVWLVLNRAGMRRGVSPHDIEERLGMKLAHLIPDDPSLVVHTINRGVPLAMSHSRTAVGRALGQLARHLIEDLSPQTAPARSNIPQFLLRPRMAAQSGEVRSCAT